jgi:flagellar hook-associated protein 3 FlgL
MSGSLINTRRNVTYALMMNSRELSRLQEQTTSGRRINHVSDDPADAYQLLGLKSQETKLTNYKDNLVTMVNTFEMASSIVQSMGTEIVATKTLLTQVTGGVYGDSGRQRMAKSLDDHLEQMVLLANSKHINQYLFSGSKSNQVPYTVTRNTSGQITAVAYQGGQNQRTVETAPGVETDMYWVGDDIFASDSRETPTFVLENTGATIGSGTPSDTGDAWLTVTVNGASYDLSIDGGTAVTVSGAADATNIPVTNPSGKTLYINGSAITGAGTDVISIPGTYNVFDTLISVRDALENDTNLPEYQLQEVLTGAISWATELHERLLQAEGNIGSKTGYMDDLRDILENMTFDVQEERQMLEEADIAQIAIDFSRHNVLYEMSLSVAGKLMSMTLLDFLR